MTMHATIRRIRCRLIGHRWQEVRVVKDIDLVGTDQDGEMAYVVNTAEWQIHCTRCGTTSPLGLRDLSATSFGFKP